MANLADNDGPFLIGDGWYDNLSAFRLVVNDDLLSLEPYGMQHACRMMIATNLLFWVFFGVLLYFIAHANNQGWVLGAVFSLGIATCILFDIVVYYRFRNAYHRGPIFRYHKKSGLIELPDRGLEFSAGDSIHIECITARESADDTEDPNSELNFVLTNGVEVNRWNLMRSTATIRPFGEITSRLAKELPIEVRRV